MDNRAIGIFDSGVGGLTVYREIKKILPNESYIYIGDTSRFPYGNKSRENILEISSQIVEYLISCNVKLIIIACGTVTSQALEYLKSKYNIPIIGIIEPTVQKAINITTKKIGIIATEGTIRSKEWEKAIHNKNPKVKIISKATPLLAPMAEEGWTNNEIASMIIHKYMKSLKIEKIEKLILGCTHYVLFRDLIKNELGNDVEIIDTGEQISIFLKLYLKNKECGIIKKREEIYLTDTNCNFVNIANSLLGYKINVKKIDF